MNVSFETNILLKRRCQKTQEWGHASEQLYPEKRQGNTQHCDMQNNEQ